MIFLSTMPYKLVHNRSYFYRHALCIDDASDAVSQELAGCARYRFTTPGIRASSQQSKSQELPSRALNLCNKRRVRSVVPASPTPQIHPEVCRT